MHCGAWCQTVASALVDRGARPVVFRLAQIALAWLLTQPGITAPIIGATKLNHLTDAVAALLVRLSPEEMKALEEPYAPHPVLGFS